MFNATGGCQDGVRRQGGEVAQDDEDSGNASWYTAGKSFSYGV